MFDLIAKTLRSKHLVAVADVEENAAASTMRAEVETLFRADMDVYGIVQYIFEPWQQSRSGRLT